MYCETQKELEDFVDRARNSEVLAIDTEFLREKTYYAKLCLLQLSTDDEVLIVDPFAHCDLTVLAELFENENITKLVHAGNQDLEILFRVVGVLPCPVFDTQLAAALIGFPQQIGYGALVQSLCGVSLKKGDSFTDWSARPLAASQLKYAADDVIYLPPMYRKLKERLEELDRLSWLDEDFAELSSPEFYFDDPRERLRRLKRANTLSRVQLACAREVAEWREVEARQHDIPRKWVLTDEQVVEACKREPRSIEELFMVRGIRERLAIREARALLAAIERGLKTPADQLPLLDNGGRNEPNVDVQLDLMNALVRLRAKQNSIAPQVLASHSELTLLARGHAKGLDILSGWRRHMIGDELLMLLEGKIALGLKGEELCVINVEGETDKGKTAEGKPTKGKC